MSTYNENGMPVPIVFVEGSSEVSRLLYEDNLTATTVQIKVRGGLELSSAASNADGSIAIVPPSGSVSFSEIRITLTTAGQSKITRAGTRAGLYINGTPIASLLLTLIPWDRLDAFAETPPTSYVVQSDEQRKTLIVPVGRMGPNLDWSAIFNKPATFPPSSHTHPSSQLSDSTAAGRALLTATDVPAQRTALGLGTAAQQPSSAFEPAGGVATEAAARVAADSSLDTRLDAVEADLPTRATSAALTAESSARVSADNALDARLDTVEATLPNKADLVGGKVPSSQIPAISLGETFTVANQAAMLSLTAQSGDVAIRTDQGNQRYLLAGTATVLADWVPLNVPDAIVSVNGQSGAVVLGKADVGLGNVDNTSDANKPVSGPQQTALNLKLDLSATTTYSRSLLDDVDAAAARATLGLGTAATRDVPSSGNATATQVPLGNDTRLRGGQTADEGYLSLFNYLSDAQRTDSQTGTPTLDYTTALQNLCNDAKAQGKLIAPWDGTIRITAPVRIECSGDFGELVVRLDSSAVAEGLIVGSATSTPMNGAKLRLPSVVNSAKSGTGWSGFQTGVRVDYVIGSSIMFRAISGFAFGVDLGSSTAGVGIAYNVFEGLAGIITNRVNLRLKPRFANGWVNQNQFAGFRFAHSSSEGSNIAGTRCVLLEPHDVAVANNAWPNGNEFRACSFEGDTSERFAEICGQNNLFIGCRWETTNNAGNPPRVQITAHSSNANALGNWVIGGFGASLIAWSFVGNVPPRNGLLTDETNRFGGAGLMNAWSNISSSGSTGPVLRVYQSGQNPLSKDLSSTDWMYSYYANGQDFKRNTDPIANPRMSFDFTNSTIRLGNGTAPPPAAISFGGGTILFTVGANGIAPATDNASPLGLGSLRWSTVFAGTGTINTSDERHKRDIRSIEDKVLDAWGDVEWVQYRWEDGQRLHFGLIAQRVKAAFEKHGLDAFEYGILCFDQWEDRIEDVQVGMRDVFDEYGMKIAEEPVIERRVTVKAGDRYGIRYDEAQALEAAWVRRELAKR